MRSARFSQPSTLLASAGAFTWHAAVEARRAELGVTWTSVAAQVGLGMATLARLAKGGRATYPDVLRVTRWLGQPTSNFVRPQPR